MCFLLGDVDFGGFYGLPKLGDLADFPRLGLANDLILIGLERGLAFAHADLPNTLLSVGAG